MTPSPAAKRERKARTSIIPVVQWTPASPEKLQELTQYAHQYLSAALESVEVRESAYHARHLFRTNPALYAQTYQALLSGQPPYVVCDRYKANYDAVCEIRRIYPEIVTAGRKQIVYNLEQVALSLSNRLATEGTDIPIDKAAGTLATVIEKLQLLTGGVTSRSEHVNAPKPEELKAMFDQLPSANVEVIEERSAG